MWTSISTKIAKVFKKPTMSKLSDDFQVGKKNLVGQRQTDWPKTMLAAHLKGSSAKESRKRNQQIESLQDGGRRKVGSFWLSIAN